MRLGKQLAAVFSLTVLACLLVLVGLSPAWAAHPPWRTPALADLPIAYGQTVTGVIAAPAQVVTYTFAAAAGDVIIAGLSDDDAAFDPEVTLLDSNDTPLASNWDGGNYVELIHTLPASGTYRLVVGDNGATDSAAYALYLQRLNGPANAAPLALGQMTAGSIIQPAQMNAYTVTVSAGDVALFGLADDNAFFEPEIRLYAADGSAVTSNWSAGNYVELNRTFTLPGVFTVLVRDRGGTEAANYTLNLQRFNNPLNAAPIAAGGVTAGAITLPGEVNFYTFTVAAGDMVLARLSDNSGLFSPQLRLYTAPRARLQSASDPATGWN